MRGLQNALLALSLSLSLALFCAKHTLRALPFFSNFVFPDGPLQEIPTSQICNDYALNLARHGTIQGSVLLKNAEKTLPLLKSEHLAVIGPNNNLSHAIATYYGGSEPCNGFTNMVDAVAQHAASTTQALGCQSVTSAPDAKMLAAAVALARAADKVSVLLCTVTFYANLAHSLTRSP